MYNLDKRLGPTVYLTLYIIYFKKIYETMAPTYTDPSLDSLVATLVKLPSKHCKSIHESKSPHP